MATHAAVERTLELKKTLAGKRILICGKGGSGKSTVVALLAHVLQSSMRVLVLDGDASNPGGVARLLFGRNASVQPLIDWFGGREHVQCPVDDPSGLTRRNDSTTLATRPVALVEIDEKYYLRRGNVFLFQTGKTQKPFEGCDGPMSKVARDFVLAGDHVTLVDVEAGLEHFGRGIGRKADFVWVVIDPTFESIAIAKRVSQFCQEMAVPGFWALINKAQNVSTELTIRRELGDEAVPIIGSVPYDPVLEKIELQGDQLPISIAHDRMQEIVQALVVAYRAHKQLKFPDPRSQLEQLFLDQPSQLERGH